MQMQRFRTCLTAIVMAALPLMAAVGVAGADPASAVVVSTDRLEIRSCPEPSCAVLGTAALGATIEITGEAVDGYLPVEYEGTSGFALAPYVATDVDHPPYPVAGAPGCNRVALIFNIGVGEEPATGILDTLKQEEVPATMFVMGWWAEQNPPVLQRMVDEGYPIGSHGYASQELTTMTDAEVVNNVLAAKAAIAAAIGRPPDPYFTPYAAATDARVRHLVAEQGELMIGWEVPAADYGVEATEESVYRRVMDNIYDGAIVELHLDGPASAASTGRALPRIIDELREQGYRFVTIPEMLEPC